MDNIVKIKVIDVPTSRINVKSSKKTTPAILPGVGHTLTPAMDKFGRLITGTKKEDYEKIMKDEINPPGYDEFYKKLSVRINENGKELNLSVPKHKLMYNFLKTLKSVASEKEKVNSSIHKYYIIDEDEQAVKKLSSIQAKTKAYKIFADMSPVEVRDFLVLYGKDSKTVSNDVALAKLGEFIEKDPNKFISLHGDETREVRINLLKLERLGVVRKENGAYFYGEKEDNPVFLGATEEMSVLKLIDPENQDLYITLISQLK